MNQKQPEYDVEQVNIFEVGPRDGLQSIDLVMPTSVKVELINALSEVGFKKMEVASFVSPEKVPQMADSEQLLSQISRNPDVLYTALTPNLIGYERAQRANVDEVAVFASASEGFSQANLNCSIDESLRRFEAVLALALEDNRPVRAYLSNVIACPYDGPTLPEQVSHLTERLLQMGCYEVSLGDTIGAGDKDSFSRLLDVVLETVDPAKLAGHFHDTHNTAIEMIEIALEHGIHVFDSSVAGLGGCPFAPGASGNIDTRLAINVIQKLGYKTGIKLEKLKSAEALVDGF